MAKKKECRIVTTSVNEYPASVDYRILDTRILQGNSGSRTQAGTQSQAGKKENSPTQK